MNGDEKVALLWLLKGVGNEREGVVYNTPEGPKFGYETDMAPGRTALIRVLRAPGLLSPAIQHALAKAGVPSHMDRRVALAMALEPISGSRVFIVAEVTRQCRGHEAHFLCSPPISS